MLPWLRISTKKMKLASSLIGIPHSKTQNYVLYLFIPQPSPWGSHPSAHKTSVYSWAGHKFMSDSEAQALFFS